MVVSRTQFKTSDIQSESFDDHGKIELWDGDVRQTRIYKSVEPLSTKVPVV